MKVEQFVQIVYPWTYLIVAVNPVAEAVRWAWVSNLKGASLAPVLSTWKSQEPFNALVWDGAPGHRSPWVCACGVPLITLPSYSPELDPAERIFRAIRPEIEGEVYANLEEKRAKVDRWLQAFAKAPRRIRSLTAWDCLVPQITTAIPVRVT